MFSYCLRATHHLKYCCPFRIGFLFAPTLIFLILSLGAPAAVTVDPSTPITHKVVVQPIRTKDSVGNAASFMGDASTEAYIKGQINLIWAQLGVEIEWLSLVDYTNDFAYDGSPGNYTSNYRPNTHLGSIINGASTPPKSSDTKVLNMFFVEICPFFSALDGNTAAGYARVDGNGSTIFVGANLLTFTNGRDVVASVIAHEIGHNLGLDHLAYNPFDSASQANLMYSPQLFNPASTGEKLTPAQKTTIFTNGPGIDSYDFLQTLPPESAYLTWAELNTLTEGPDGDDDDDKLSNAFEFLYGSSPTNFTPHPPATVSPQGLTWSLPKTTEAVNEGFSYLAESNLTLGSWLPAGSTNSGSSVLSDTASIFSVRLDSGYPKAFIRFTVDIPASAEESESSESLIEVREAKSVVAEQGYQISVMDE